MKLAINGGDPVRTKPFPPYNTIGQKEKDAVERVLNSGILSNYLGCWHEHFYGGHEVQSLEKEWAGYFNVKHAIAVNSCTSGLYCAVGAIGTEPGDEIIVSPYTMTSSAVAPLIYNAIPVFADIEEDYFCLDPESVEQRITNRTRAIIVVDLFGLPYDVEKIRNISKKHKLKVIEDCAQAPGAKYKERFAGTFGDIGIYSLNYHKHIHCGEGGVVVTNDDEIAERVQLIRNHAEAVVEAKGVESTTNMIGFNYRMTEIEAAIARCQLRKLDNLIVTRQNNCKYLERGLSEIPPVTIPPVRKGSKHVYYVHPLKFSAQKAGVSREQFIEAVKAELSYTELRKAEGVKISCGYVKPLYLQPVFQKKICYGSKGFPFKSPFSNDNTNYSKGICPVSERMHEKEFFMHELMHSFMTEKDLDDVIKAFYKVWENRSELP